MPYVIGCIIFIMLVFMYSAVIVSKREDMRAAERFAKWQSEYDEGLEEAQKVIEGKNGEKCKWSPDFCVKPDGVNELDPCFYEEVETHYNCTVHVLRCKNCGHYELEWEKQDEWIEDDDYYKEDSLSGN